MNTMEKFDMTKITSGFENLFDSMTNEKALSILKDTFELTDEEIRELGLDYLLPEEEELNEPPAPVYDYEFLYRQTWSGIFHVYAHNEEEAMELWQKEMDEGLDTCALDQLDDDGWNLLSVT